MSSPGKILIKYVDYNGVCHCCSEKCEMKSRASRQSHYEMLTDCFGKELCSDARNLSNFSICSECSVKLSASSAFRKQVQETQNKLYPVVRVKQEPKDSGGLGSSNNGTGTYRNITKGPARDRETCITDPLCTAASDACKEEVEIEIEGSEDKNEVYDNIASVKLDDGNASNSSSPEDIAVNYLDEMDNSNSYWRDDAKNISEVAIKTEPSEDKTVKGKTKRKRKETVRNLKKEKNSQTVRQTAISKTTKKSLFDWVTKLKNKSKDLSDCEEQNSEPASLKEVDSKSDGPGDVVKPNDKPKKLRKPRAVGIKRGKYKKRNPMKPKAENVPKPKYISPHNKKPYELNETDVVCPICGVDMLTHGCLLRHMNIHYPKYVCHTCGKTFMTRLALIHHSRVHNQRRVTCKECNKTVLKRSLKNHIELIHLGKKVYPCSMCEERFKNDRHRVTHMETVHNVFQSFTCPICSKVFNMHRKYKYHLYTTHNPHKQPLINASFVCDVCDKQFTTKGKLQAHIKTHSSERNFQCHLCSNSYKLKTLLTRHIKTHDDSAEKFICAICDSKFVVRYMLKRHMRDVHKVEVELSELVPRLPTRASE